MTFPKKVYVYEEKDRSTGELFFVLVSDPKDREGDGPIGVYELRDRAYVRHVVEVTPKKPSL